MSGDSSKAPTLRQVFDEHAEFVLRCARRYGVRPADVEDVAQETFVVVLRRYADYDPSRSMRSWLAGIVRRVAAGHMRRAHNKRELVGADVAEPSTEAVQEEQALLRQRRRILDEALDQLDEKKRPVYVLFELEGMPMAEVADAVEVPLQTAYARLYAARKVIHATIEASLAEEAQ